MDELEFRIARLELRPGDILVAKAKIRLSVEQAERLRTILEPFVGERKVMVLDDSVDIAVLTREEIEARAA